MPATALTNRGGWSDGSERSVFSSNEWIYKPIRPFKLQGSSHAGSHYSRLCWARECSLLEQVRWWSGFDTEDWTSHVTCCPSQVFSCLSSQHVPCRRHRGFTLPRITGVYTEDLQFSPPSEPWLQVLAPRVSSQMWPDVASLPIAICSPPTPREWGADNWRKHMAGGMLLQCQSLLGMRAH